MEKEARAFHLLVKNCPSAVFDIQTIIQLINFKWKHNVRKIVLVHLGGYTLSLVLATVAMVLSTQSGKYRH